MLITKPRSSPSTPVRVRSPHSMTITASPGSSTRLATSIFVTPGKTEYGPGAGSWFTIRASFPRCHSAWAIANCEPIESPSGRTCDESTKRCLPRISSAIRARMAVSVAAPVIVWGSGILAFARRASAGKRVLGFAFGCALRVLLVDVAEDLFDAVLVGDRLVEPELDLRHAPELQPRADLAPEEAGRPLQRARRLGARLLVAEAGVEDARHLEVRGDLHARQRDEPDARVVDFAAGEHFAEDVADLFPDSVWPVALSHQKLRRRHLLSLHREHLDGIAHLDVVVALEADAALEARLHLAHVVLEAAQRGDLPLVHHDVVAKEAGGRLAGARDASLGDHAAGNRTNLRDLEDLADFRPAHPHFLVRRLEEALHAFLDLFGDGVDHRVEADVDLLALGHVGRIAIGPHVEADDDRVGRRRQQHVGLVDGADAGPDDADLALLLRELRERVGEHFRRALHVRFDDDRQFLDAAFGNLLFQRFERQAAAARAERTLLRLPLAEGGNLPRLRGVGHRLERIPPLRQAR